MACSEYDDSSVCGRHGGKARNVAHPGKVSLEICDRPNFKRLLALNSEDRAFRHQLKNKWYCDWKGRMRFRSEWRGGIRPC